MYFHRRARVNFSLADIFTATAQGAQALWQLGGLA
jgi:hypothetical protein